jgi:uncharacterized protein DUF4249
MFASIAGHLAATVKSRHSGNIEQLKNKRAAEMKEKNIFYINRLHRSRLFFMLLLMVSNILCKKAYEPAVLKSDNRFLVINGLINTAPGSATIIELSRTLNLIDTVVFVPELHAGITIESKRGSLYPLVESGNGSYHSDSLSLDNTDSYRLNITTGNGKKYQSDFVECRQTPPIDSITWKQEGNVVISVNTHDPSGNSRYYKWDFEETWMNLAQLHTIWGAANGKVYLRDTLTQCDSCWNTRPSTDILLGTSSALSQDVIHELPIVTIPANEKRLDYRYSILLRQYVLTPDAYHYWQIIQKNSQQLGTLFDPQPSQINGNIHETDNPDEPVIGFVTAASVREVRFFIRNNQLDNWHSIPAGFGCEIYNTGLPFPFYNVADTNLGPYYYMGGALVVASNACTDCRFLGGTNQKPSYWVNY